MTKDQEVLMAVVLDYLQTSQKDARAKQSLLQRNPAFGQQPEHRTVASVDSKT
jgi:hypothetical protein